MFNRRLLQATSGGIFLFPLMFLASNARGTLRLTNVNNGKYLDTANGLVYFNNDILRAAVSSGLFMFPCNVLYCGYNREIEKLPITASIA